MQYDGIYYVYFQGYRYQKYAVRNTKVVAITEEVKNLYRIERSE